MKLKIFGLTDIGKIRTNNEDAYYINEDESIMILSDGMGGQEAGEIASAIVVKMLPRQIAVGKSTDMFLNIESSKEYLIQSLGILSETVLEKGIEFPQYRGMGATVVACILLDKSLIVTHLGDSRAYLLRNEVLERLTVDHNMAELLFENNMITLEEYQTHPGRHMLRKFIGMVDCPEADVNIVDLEKGDRILMCSDGLTGMVKDQIIGQVLLDYNDPKLACEKLIELANKAGGNDNITVVIADVPLDSDEKEKYKKVKVRQGVRKVLHIKEKL